MGYKMVDTKEVKEHETEAYWDSLMDEEMPYACCCSACGHIETHTNRKGNCPHCHARMS